MSDKMLREWIESQREMNAAMKTTLARELDAARSSARDAALEEAARAFDGVCVDCREGPINPEHERCWHEAEAAKRIRALQAQPAQVVSVEEVREAMLACGDMDDPNTVVLLSRIVRRLGVDLDATRAQCAGDPDCGWHNGGPCGACKPNLPREPATVESGLLPAPRCTFCGERHTGACQTGKAD